MAEKRMIGRAVSQSRKLSKVSLKAALIWTWSIPFFDSYGYMEADPDWIKFNVVPRRSDISLQDIAGVLQELSGIKLWKLYKLINDEKIIAFDPKFKDFQTLRQERLGTQKFTPGALQDYSGTTPAQDKINEVKIREVKKERERLPFGEFLNIFLTEEEKKKLQTKYGDKPVQDKIESFSNSLKSQPQKYSKYKDHYSTLNNWLRNDGTPTPQAKQFKETFVVCPKCGKETTKEDLRNLESCPSCFKPIPIEKLKDLISGIGKDVK